MADGKRGGDANGAGVLPLSLTFALTMGLLLGSAAASEEGRPIGSPVWLPGTWWDVRVSDPGQREPIPARLVVAQDGSGGFRFGLASPEPRLLFSKTVPHGRVDPATFGFHIGDASFHALRFPLYGGKSWSTTLAGEPVTATVTDVANGAASVTYQIHRAQPHPFGFPATLNATYDSRLGFFSRFEQPNGQTATVIGSGSGECRIWQAEGAEEFQGDLAGYRRNGVASVEIPSEITTLAMRLAIVRSSTGASPDSVEAFESTTVRVVGPSLPGSAGGLVSRAPETYELAQQGDPFNETAFHVVDNRDGSGPSGNWSVTRSRGSLWGPGVPVSEFVGYRSDVFLLADPLRDCRSERAGAHVALVSAPERSGIGWIVLGISALAIGYGLRPGGIAWTLLARIRPDRVFEHPTRQRILETIQKDPGITTQEIRRSLELPWATTAHHLKILERLDVAVAYRPGRQVHWFSAAQGALARDRIAQSALRSSGTAAVFDFIRANPGRSLAAVARGLGVQHTTVRFHLRKLMRAELLEGRLHGRRSRYYPKDQRV